MSGCSTVAYVNWNTPIPGATLIEQPNGNNIGVTPVRVQYDYAGQVPDENGCYRVRGVTAKWASGYQNSSPQLITLCQGATEYSMSVPYAGSTEQRMVDEAYAQAHIENLMVLAQQQAAANQQSQQQSSDLWVTAVVAAMGAGTAAAYPNVTNTQPTTTYAPRPSIAPLQQAGCTSDFQCGAGKLCVKGPMQTRGECVIPVDSLGQKQIINSMPRPNSIMPNLNTQGSCNFNTDCSIGFKCDTKLKVCVK